METLSDKMKEDFLFTLKTYGITLSDQEVEQAITLLLNSYTKEKHKIINLIKTVQDQ